MRTISRTIELTKAQIEALHTTAVPLVLAPVSGKAVVVLGAQIWKTSGLAATSTDADLSICYGAATTGDFLFTNVDNATGALGDNAQNRIQVATIVGSIAAQASGAAVSLFSNQAITCGAGDTTAKVKIDFQIIDL